MLSFLLPLVLSSPLLSEVPHFIEKIRIADSLTIEAKYLPQGSFLNEEAMVLTVEDFGVLQAEVEKSTEACDLRLKSLDNTHQELLEEAQLRCIEKNSTYKIELDKAQAVNKHLRENLVQERSNHRLQKWVNVGIIIGGGVLTAVVLSR